MKYIFVTGGVVSSLGKGLTAASLGTLLEARRLRVVLQKFDPYLNGDHGDRRHYRRHRRSAVFGSDPAIHSRSWPAKRREHARHACSVHQGSARIKNKADAAKCSKAARDRLAATSSDLPHRKTARPRRAQKTVDVL